MRKLFAVGLGLLFAVTVASPSVANEARVEGDSHSKLLLRNDDGTITLLWACSAEGRGARFASTGIKCTVTQGEVQVDYTSEAMESNRVITKPRLLTIADAPFKICWEARAMLVDGAQFVYDVTEPNCENHSL